MNCSNCGMQLSSHERFCTACGTPVQQQYSQTQYSQSQQQQYSQTQQPYSQTQQNQSFYQSTPGIFCPECGTELFGSDVFCPTCGRSLKEPAVDYSSYDSKKKSQTGLVVAIVALAVLIAVAVGAVVYVLYSRNNNNDNGDSGYTDTTDNGGSDNGSDNGDASPTHTPTPPPPVFTGVSATSTRNYDVDETNGEVVYYYPSYAVDGDMYTAWSSDRNIELTPTITLTANEKQYVSGIRMTNGYCKSQKTYEKNRRITEVRVTYQGGEVVANFGINNFGNMIDVPFPEPVYTDYVSIKVLKNHYGSWMDIAISEIEVY